MLDYDARTVYTNWMESGYRLEIAKKYDFAKSRYADAKKLADTFSDEAASKRAEQRINACNERQRGRTFA